MEAIEFRTVIHKGRVSVPPRYSSRWEGKMMRVIVLDDSEIIPDSSQKTEKTMFEAISLNTRGFRFDRDEANAR
ncbi:MAG: hypothetical protein ACK5QJ_06560 [Microcystis sp.]|jgi:hypothetical protein|uniref:hypothetical protein n=1 Tax=Microcystis sp. TaxID=1127 RepID=UPI0022CB1F83|nr:hypothetical protein [Microcystis sp. LE17-20D]MCZ8067354.1 hypothetical protein [Microcystis sp. LE17-20D]MCZ8163129.1 hypothetical protein [Microcystis sp. LE19-196.1B]